jgi:hypothetical protein
VYILLACLYKGDDTLAKYKLEESEEGKTVSPKCPRYLHHIIPHLSF